MPKKATHGGPRAGSGRPKLAAGTQRVILSSTSVAPETPHRLAHIILSHGLRSLGAAIDWLVRDVRPDE